MPKVDMSVLGAIVVRAIAERDPTFNNGFDELECFFCGQHDSARGDERFIVHIFEKCLWLQCRNALDLPIPKRLER